MNKVVLILVDGMRPDGMLQSGHPAVERFLRNGASTLSCATVMPSVTLPCHMSLIHSVDPDRHGILTNTFTPQVRPVKGLFEQLRAYDKKCSFFYGWGELKDLYHPDSLAYGCFISQYQYTLAESADRLTQKAAEYLKEDAPDFTFLYLGEVDEVGHKYGWMTPQYFSAVRHAFDCIERIEAAMPKDAVLMITADHGGHDRGHGSDMPEDMVIPLIACGGPYGKGQTFSRASIKDIAPTVVKHLGVPADGDWEGETLF